MFNDTVNAEPAAGVKVENDLVTVEAEAAAETVIVEVPVTVTAPDVAEAVIVAVPAATAVTNPEAETVATALLLDDHVTVAAMAAEF